jgi:hypothetical protein
MAQTFSDNALLAHPKPEFEYYRRFNGSTYVDWVDTAEVIANVTAGRRPQKRYRIANNEYICQADGTTFILAVPNGGGSSSLEGTLFS